MKRLLPKNIIRSFRYTGRTRGDFVVYVLLNGFFILSLLCLSIITVERYNKGASYQGAPIWLGAVFVLAVLALLQLFRAGYRTIVSSFFLFLILLATLNITFSSGVQNPYALFLLILYIILAAIIFRDFVFLATLILMLLSYSLSAYFEISGMIHPDLSWKLASSTPYDLFGFLLMFSIIALVSWLFNSEIKNYVSQLEKSKVLLQKERDLLEIKVAERTKRLQEEQAEKLAQFSRFAEFGRLAQGLFHDLINPLTALSLNLSGLKKNNSKQRFDFFEDHLNGAVVAANNMDNLIRSTRNTFRHEVDKRYFSIADELESIFLILKYKAQKAGVTLVFQKKDDLQIYGNKTRFSQLISNLVSNGIEAYRDKKNAAEKKVVVSFYEKNQSIFIEVEDFGSGISSENLKKIYSPFFSTKESEGNTGIGLSTSKDIVETDFLGKIAVESKLSSGTKFTIELPKIVV